MPHPTLNFESFVSSNVISIRELHFLNIALKLQMKFLDISFGRSSVCNALLIFFRLLCAIYHHLFSSPNLTICAGVAFSDLVLWHFLRVSWVRLGIRQQLGERVIILPLITFVFKTSIRSPYS